MSFDIPAVYYYTIYVIVFSLLSVFICSFYSFSNTNEHIRNDRPITQVMALFVTIVVIFFIGLRPKAAAFVDMNYYAYVYNNIYDGSMVNYTQDERGEWLFYEFGNFCKKLGFSDTYYFLSIAAIYFGLMLASCYLLMRRNLFVSMLFCLVSFSCFSYAVNGMRNGMACGFAMMAIALLSGNNWSKALSLLLMLCAYYIHNSTALPCFCAISALLIVKNTKWAIYFWVTSIFISLIAGNYVTELFVNMDFDERMGQYANLETDSEFKELYIEDSGYRTGFRIDFIFYSIMPIIMAWYVTIKRNFKDLAYHILATTYTLANSFWILIIRSEQSNRFAYLSWFLYPLVIAYPLLRMNLWEDQDRKTGFILLVYAGFTFFMHFVYYA